jgi:hypothetical protein
MEVLEKAEEGGYPEEHFWKLSQLAKETHRPAIAHSPPGTGLAGPGRYLPLQTHLPSRTFSSNHFLLAVLGGHEHRETAAFALISDI